LEKIINILDFLLNYIIFWNRRQRNISLGHLSI